MLRAPWALISLPFIPGVRSRLDRPIPVFFSPNLRLWRQDRYFASSPKLFAVKGSDVLEASNPVAAPDATAGTLEDAPEMFTPSTELTSSFRFPPFPLAVVEKPESQLSAPDEPESDTDIFESPSPEYARVYERLPGPSADILTQVVRSLPELLPEPETDSASIFEEKSDIDYAETSFSPAHPITSTRSLEILVEDRNYDQALRVLAELLEVGTEIPFSSAYETAAMSAVKFQAQTQAEADDQVESFKKWFSLIPLADQSRPRKFLGLRRRLMSSQLNSLRLMMEFGLIAAEKGYASSTHSHVTSLVSMYGDPDVTIQFIAEIRHRNRAFLERSSKAANADILDHKLHVDMVGLAARTLASAGRLDHAVQLIPDPSETDFQLKAATYDFLLQKLKAARDPRYLPHINFIAQFKSEIRLRSMGLKKMAKDKLCLAIRCLADVGEFDLAIRLLSDLEGAEAALVAPTLDILLEKLQDGGDDRYSVYIERVSQLRQAVSIASSAATETSESQSTQLAGESLFAPAVEALTRAWCLDEALALIPFYHRANTSRRTKVYHHLLRKLRGCHSPKYRSYMAQVERMLEEKYTVKSARVTTTTAEADTSAAQHAPEDLTIKATDDRRLPSDFSAADVYMSSFFPSRAPERTISLVMALRALKKGFRALTPSLRPHPLTVVHFIELYLASGRTRAIPLLRKLALRRSHYAPLYIFAELLFLARQEKPDLVIRTFVNHFYIVGLPRDEIIIHLGTMERDLETDYLWGPTALTKKMFPNRAHTAMVWRALLEVTKDERALEDLYSKLLRFADLRSPQSSALHPGVPLLHPPPSWSTGVADSAFTPFVRRMCYAFGAERGARVLKDMREVGVKPTIYHLTELAMEYSRTGDVARTFVVLNQVETALKNWEKADATANGVTADDETPSPRPTTRNRLTPKIDQAFYVAIVRGFLLSNKIGAARDVERRMHKRFGYIAGDNQYVDELYEDLQAAEGGDEVPARPRLLSVVHSTTYKALVEKLENARHGDTGLFDARSSDESANSAGA